MTKYDFEQDAASFKEWLRAESFLRFHLRHLLLHLAHALTRMESRFRPKRKPLFTDEEITHMDAEREKLKGVSLFELSDGCVSDSGELLKSLKPNKDQPICVVDDDTGTLHLTFEDQLYRWPRARRVPVKVFRDEVKRRSQLTPEQIAIEFPADAGKTF
jgi:hypothetical protein